MGNNNSVGDSTLSRGNQQFVGTASTKRCIAWDDDNKLDEDSSSNKLLNLPKKVVVATSSIEAAGSLEFFETLNHLPDEVKNLKAYRDLSSEIIDERRKIIKKLRDLADNLAKTHTDVLIADRVGTGVGIGSGVLFIGGLVAAPFTAGLSLGLTMAGTTAGVLGGVTSAGANITGYFMSKNSLASLEKELRKHYDKLTKLSASSSKYLVYAARFRPTMEQLASLSNLGWLDLLTKLQNLIKLALKGDYIQIGKVVSQDIDPTIKKLLAQLPLPVDSEGLRALGAICTQILNHINSIRNAVKAFVKYFNKPELAKIAMIYTSAARTTTTMAAHEVSEVKSAFKGTPMAMTKTARIAAGALTTAFIVIDVIHMVRICKETGETPTVQELRKMADELENEMAIKSD